MIFINQVQAKYILFYFNSKKNMKKTKRERSVTTKVKQYKTNLEFKSSVPSSKKNIHQKKPEECHKENKSLVQQSFLIPKVSKKVAVKTKERSKSLLFDRKNDVTNKASHHIMVELQKKVDKSETDISGNINSIRYERHHFDFDKNYSNFLSPHRQCGNAPDYSQIKSQDEMTPKLKQLQQENETLRTSLSAIRQEINAFKLEKKVVKQENAGLKQKITEFEYELEASSFQLKLKDKLLRTHQLEKQQLQAKAVQLQLEQHTLIKEKATLETLVKNQQCNISLLEKEKKELEEKCRLEIQEKQTANREKEEAVIRIQSLQVQLQLFESNLKEFQLIKNNYEEKLMTLKAEKETVKKNALELLQLVHSYQNGIN